MPQRRGWLLDSFYGAGRVLLSGSESGLLIVSSSTTGMTLRALSDHKLSPITALDAAGDQWLAASADCRLSLWQADWSRDRCDIVDWVSFADDATPGGRCTARFVPGNSSRVLVSVVGAAAQVVFEYGADTKQKLRTIPLNQSPDAWALCPAAPALMATANASWTVKLVDLEQGTFQDFVGLCGPAAKLVFTPDGDALLAAAGSTVMVWKLAV